jgi:adenylate cyclase
MYINFIGPARSIPAISYHSVLEGDFDPSQVEGRIVLIGNTHSLGKDFFSVSTDSRMSGVEVHAHALSTILNNRFVHHASTHLLVFLTIVMGILGVSIIFSSRISAMTNLLLVIMAGLLVFASGYLLFTHLYVWLDVAPLLLSFIGNGMLTGFYQWNKSRKRVLRIRNMFGRYVSRNVVDVILSKEAPVELEGHKRNLSILFSDLRGFTPLSETVDARDVSKFLSRYFEQMIDAVFKNKGTLDKLIGDAVMAFFGAPLEVEDHPAAACRCALDMEERLEEINRSDIIPGGIPLELGIGINTGEVVVGNMGSPQYFDYTVIGDTVNLASRLESLNKHYKTRIIISEATYSLISNYFLCRELDFVRVKGKLEPTQIYELLPDKGSAMIDAVEHYQIALSYYRKGQWQDALKELHRALTVHPEDGPSQKLSERCRLYIEHPPPADWNGVWELSAI